MRPAHHSTLVRALVVLALIASAPATAHEVRPAYLQIVETAPERFSVLWKQPIVQDRRLAIDPVLPNECPPQGDPVPEVIRGALVQQWEVACPLDQGAIHISGLARTLTDVMVDIERLDGEGLTALLRPNSPSLDLDDPTPQVAAYLWLGIEHLLFGIDHVLFVVGLVYLIPSRWALLKTVTAFTLAHSITLALSVLELVRLPQGPVEAVIALSIVFLARELLLPAEHRSKLTDARPWLMALIFGLLHGFGFAGALADIGLPRDQLAPALLLFNIGIEVGQIMIIVALLAFLGAARSVGLRPPTAVLQGVAQPGGVARAQLGWIDLGLIYAIGILAAYWTLDRVLGLL